MNPLLQTFDTPHASYPFEKIKPEDFASAFDLAIEQHYKEIDEIASDNEQPSFSNTILAIERSGRLLDKVSSAFFNLLHANSNDYLEELQESIVPKLSALASQLNLNESIFKKVKSLWDQREKLGLDKEEMRLLYNNYEGFIHSGALLDPDKKEKLKELNERISSTTAKFGQNVLRDSKRYRLHIEQSEQVKGMPQTVLNIAAEKARSEGKQSGWLFDLSGPSFTAFMMHCPIAELRKEMYMAKMQVGAANNEYNNEANIRSIVNTRLEKAKLLGYKSYAEYALKHRMLKKASEVEQLLDDLLGSDEAFKAKALAEIDEISQWLKQEKMAAGLPLEIWDWSYWAQKYKEAQYQFDDEELRPYFELSNVLQGVWHLAGRLYGLRFVESQEYQRYHPDVRTFEVYDHDDSFLAVLYTDFFPRDNKQSGAWMSSLIDQEEGIRPQIMIVMNFTPATQECPSLLTLGEVNTLLHEFGHALHGMLSQCRFASLSGTSVARDFVELPSQIMENWLDEKEFLDSFARHYQTGEALPQALLDKVLASRNYLIGYATCRQLSFGYLDMAWHGIEQALPSDCSIKEYESTAWQKAQILPPSPEEAVMSCSFNHIFSGGYAAGYYGYKWAEVLEADAYSLFQEHGIFDREIATKFRKEILEKGDTEEAMDLFVAFRGRKPEIKALLTKQGIAIERDSKAD